MKAVNILLEKHLAEMGLEFVREFRFCPERRWRADYRLENITLHGLEVLLEIEGAVYVQGRHTRGKGYEKDMRKYNTAAKLGFVVIRFSTNMVLRGEAKAFLQEWLKHA